MSFEGRLGRAGAMTEIKSYLPEDKRVLLRRALLFVMLGAAVPPDAEAYTPNLETHAQYQTELDRKNTMIMQMKKAGIPYENRRRVKVSILPEQHSAQPFSEDKSKIEFADVQKIAEQFAPLYNQYQKAFNLAHDDHFEPKQSQDYETEFERARIAAKALRPLFHIAKELTEYQRIILTPPQSRLADTAVQTRFMDVPVISLSKLLEDGRLRSQVHLLIDAMNSFLQSSPDAQRDAIEYDRQEWEKEGETIKMIQDHEERLQNIYTRETLPGQVV